MGGEHSLLKDKERDVYGELLAASKLDVKTVGSDALAEVTGYRKQSIDRCLRRPSSKDEGRQQSLSLFMLADLIAFSEGGALRTLRLLNELAGLQVLPRSDLTDLPHGAGAVAGVSLDFSHLLGGMSEAMLDDGQITADEILELDLIERAEKLHLDALALKERFKRRVAAKGGGS
ncbi:hypothetical protein [uncultured Cohaesibacter sp.]|uniref:hypothetical protein n=1 Tax=uncultured Cohaesibacter sp. TaxID=1002546 RepID=UPI0029C8D848|nr:hypothetical protein [uncultured Cohaesibacter sp.]